ncbi:arrestin domain-containing protein 3-like [Argopecten irradians]|uniref:arrestin domain-containing protein 3-like n=1 Tax=Argopecten irradians TaxID=31199 RepID=UPI00371F80E9
MGKLKSFCITFTNTNGVCFAGKELEGAVVVDLATKYKMKELRLRFRGYALVHWTENHSSGQGKSKRTVTKHYTGEELYFDHTVILFASSGDNCETIAMGKHTFPFEFQVPSTCPTSHEGTWGRIRYETVATIEKLFGVGISTVNGFTVINPFDLNDDSRARESITAENEMSLCCLCCKSGPICASLILDNVGFVPGETIPIRAEVVNHSNRKIADMTASLNMIVKYYAVKKVRSHTNIIASISQKEFVSKGKMVTWYGDSLKIPSVPPSFVPGCHIIDISYVLELLVNPAGPSFNLPVKIEVIIGSKPLTGTWRAPSITRNGHSTVPDPIGIAEDNYLKKNGRVPSEIYTNGEKFKSDDVPHIEPIMTFAECILGTVDLVDNDEFEDIPGPVNFTPMYTYYKDSQSAVDTSLIKPQ